MWFLSPRVIVKKQRFITYTLHAAFRNRGEADKRTHATPRAIKVNLGSSPRLTPAEVKVLSVY